MAWFKRRISWKVVSVLALMMAAAASAESAKQLIAFSDSALQKIANQPMAEYQMNAEGADTTFNLSSKSHTIKNPAAVYNGKKLLDEKSVQEGVVAFEYMLEQKAKDMNCTFLKGNEVNQRYLGMVVKGYKAGKGTPDNLTVLCQKGDQVIKIQFGFDYSDIGDYFDVK